MVRTEYGNGKHPLFMLTQIEPTITVMPQLSMPYRMMKNAAKADGVDLVVVRGYVPYDLQPVPGTMDNGWGIAIDFDTSDFTHYAWLHAHAWEYCFQELYTLDHWVFNPLTRKPHDQS